MCISPDGAYLAWLAPHKGVLNVWVAPRQDLASAQVVTHDILSGIPFFTWAYNNTHILYIQDQGGDENWHIYSADLSGNAATDLTPFDSVQARIEQISEHFPNEIVVGLNNRVPHLHDLYRLNILTGEMTLLEENPGFMRFIVRDDYQVAAAFAMTPEGGLNFLLKHGSDWDPWESIPPEDMLTTNPVGLNKANTHLYMTDTRGRNTGALFEVELGGSGRRLLVEDPRCDAGEVIVHPIQKHVQAVSFTYDRKRWQVLDPNIQIDLDFLAAVSEGEVQLLSRSLDDRFWVVAYLLDNAPLQYHLYDRQAHKAEFLFTNRTALEGAPLTKMRSFIIDAQDGLKLVGYYSLPLGCDSNDDGIPDYPMPMVLLPHGGPWGRDGWGFDSWHQWLANRGYVPMNVNFRSSTGFGKQFVNAGDKALGTDIIRDQHDAVQWAIRQGIADPARVAIMGISFGGFSTLAGLTFYPDTYACGVDIVGPSNLITLLESIPEYWKPMRDLFTTRVGDHRTPEGRALLTEQSPLTYAERICKPLLIGQGANDPRVKRAEADQIVQALRARNIPVTYVLYPDEGHGFARPENNLSFNAIAEAFLARCLEGRCEPIGSDFENSSVQILAGKEEVLGL